jgi:hypothetical protein
MNKLKNKWIHDDGNDDDDDDDDDSDDDDESWINGDTNLIV